MHILSISDTLIPFINSPQVVKKYGHVDWVIACGDLPYAYLEYIIDMLNVPLFFVRGNHDRYKGVGNKKELKYPKGGIDLNRRVLHRDGVLLAGIDGSVRYKNEGYFLYTQEEMWAHVFSLVPGLLWNKLYHRRYLDLFVTHAPPWGTHDKADFPHQGVKAFRWMIKVFKPKYHFHGHIHVYRPDEITESKLGQTCVINTFGYCETELELNSAEL